MTNLASSDEGELLCMVALTRHGDRTPKQKLKIRMRHVQLLDFFAREGLRPGVAEIKLKKPRQLQQVLDLICRIVESEEQAHGPGSEPMSDSDVDGVTLGELKQLRWVLEMSPFDGINRKMQARRAEITPRW